MPDVIQLIQSAMSADMSRLNTISQNLANANTDGYKREISTQKAFEQELVSYGGNKPEASLSVARDMSVGALKYTGNMNNLALTGNGFLKINHVNGEAYTRRGQLQLSEDGKLVLSTGEEVLGESGPIYLQPESFVIQGDGSIFQKEQLMGKLLIVEGNAQGEMNYLGKGMFHSGSPLPQASGEMIIKQGYLEASNVESLREMVGLVTTVRHYESAGQVLKGYDDMLDSAINILGEF